MATPSSRYLPRQLAEWIKLIDLPGYRLPAALDLRLHADPWRPGGPPAARPALLRSVARGEPVDLPRIPWAPISPDWKAPCTCGDLSAPVAQPARAVSGPGTRPGSSRPAQRTPSPGFVPPTPAAWPVKGPGQGRPPPGSRRGGGGGRFGVKRIGSSRRGSCYRSRGHGRSYRK